MKTIAYGFKFNLKLVSNDPIDNKSNIIGSGNGLGHQAKNIWTTFDSMLLYGINKLQWVNSVTINKFYK